MARLSNLPPQSEPANEEDGKSHDSESDHGISKLLARGKTVEIAELDISGNVQERWLHKSGDKLVPVRAEKSSGAGLFSLREWRKAIFDSFLPVGFPHSVSEDYLAYQTYDSLQAFFSTITSLLANRAILQGLGVGDASSSATFALLLTILKDAMSRIATIVFANRFGLRIEPDAKRYRFLADLFNDTAFILELFSPYFGSLGKVVTLSISEALKALCGVAAGASKAALSMHFAKHDNLAELNAKEASQETAVGLIGLLVGTVVVKWIEDPRSVVYLMMVLVVVHLWMNYLGVRSVCMDTLNRQRATIVFSEYLRTGKVLSPTEVAAREDIIIWEPTVRNQHGQEVAHLELAQSYPQALTSHSARREFNMADGPRHTKFISTHAIGQPTRIKILLLEGADARDAIGAWFSAMEMAWLMDIKKGYTAELDAMFSRSSSLDTADGIAKYTVRSHNPELWEALAEKGWDLSTQLLETGAPLRLRIREAHGKNK